MSTQIDDKLFKEWMDCQLIHMKRKLECTDVLLEEDRMKTAIKLDLLEDVKKAFEQSICEHKNTSIQEDVGYDIDEEGEEGQHLETCRDCGAERFHCDHTKHGKTTSGWLISTMEGY